MGLSHRLFQIVQALLILILVGGGIYILGIDALYGGIVITAGLALLVYDRRGFVMTLLANRAYRTKGLEEALSWLRRAWNARALDPRTQITFVYLLMKAGHFEEAEQRFQAMREPGPWFVGERNLDLLDTYRAMLLWAKEERREAVDLLWGLVQKRFWNLALLTTLGVYLVRLRDWERFEELLPVCREYDPDDLGMLDNEGAYLIEQGRLEEARNLYRDRILPRGPTFPEAWVHWARLCRRLGDRDEARAAYQKALGFEFHGLSVYTRQQVENERREVES